MATELTTPLRLEIGFPWSKLATSGQSPGGSGVATYGALKLLPFWDPLRGDPRFEQSVASLAPK